MEKLMSPADIISLPSTFEEQNRMIETLKGKLIGVQNPGQLDEATKNAGMPATLLNFYFATQVDLSSIGLGTVVHIPVMVSKREGGRKSIYFLDKNEEVLAGICVTREGEVALRFVKRVTGSSLPAQAGDVYSTRITNRDGELVFEGQEKLLKFDPQTGEGQFVPTPGTKSSNGLLAPAVAPTVAPPKPPQHPQNCLFFSIIWQQT